LGSVFHRESKETGKKQTDRLILIADEDFTTTDWVQDTLLERSRRRFEAAHATRTIGQSFSAVMWRIVEGGMSWFVVLLVGKLSFSHPSFFLED